MTLAEILCPVSVDDFAGHHVGINYLRVTGARERFAQLVPWATLNRVLDSLRTSGQRLTLVRNGTRVRPAEYMTSPSAPDGSTLQRMAIQRRLRLGDTLVVNSVQELFPGIQEILESLEKVFRVRINANLYAGFKRYKGLDLHWDEHDTLILQIHGKKAWRVYEQTRASPMVHDKPTRPPVWEGLLDSGDVLYMPRGWWHVAEPVDGPSLHVTFGIAQPTGIDLLGWLVEDLKDVEAARRNVPILAPQATQDAFVQELQDIVSRRLDDDAVGRYLSWTESQTSCVQPFALPDAAIDAPFHEQRPLILMDRGRLLFRVASDHEVSFWASGKLWRCEAGLRPALECLDGKSGQTIEDLATRVPADLRPRLQLVLMSLVEGGVLTPQMSPLEPQGKPHAGLNR